MTDISIHQPHKLSHKNAMAAAQKVANKLVEEYDMTLEWDGDVLKFNRSGVSGTLTVYAHEARIDMTLGVMLAAFAPAIKAHVAENMRSVFAGK